jgi:predicted kinase
MAPSTLPSPCLVVLVGPGASGKSTWAAAHFRPDAVVSSIMPVLNLRSVGAVTQKCRTYSLG